MEPFVAEYLTWIERENRWLFDRLLEFTSHMRDRLTVSFVFNAYQPRCNKTYKEEKPKLNPPDNPFFDNYYNTIVAYGATRKEKDTLMAVAVTDSYVPLMAAVESFPGAITLAFPQVTLDRMRNLYPAVHEQLIMQNNFGKIDLGISSYHHAFAPMLDERMLMQEYYSALEAFSRISTKRSLISLHIPECAVSPTLFDVLGCIQNKEKVKFVTSLDSDYHNQTGAYDIGMPNEITYRSKGEACGLKVMLSNNNFSRRLFSFPPNTDSKTVGFWYFTRLFESVAKPQIYPYWGRLSEGKNTNFVVHTDAETIGFYSGERVYSFYLMVHLMKCFGMKLESLAEAGRAEAKTTNEKDHLLYKTWDMETCGTVNRWMKKEYDSSTQLFFTASEIHPYLIENLTEKESEMNSKEKKRLWAARARFANALTSCPHWWGSQDSVAGKQFARDIVACGRHIRKLKKFLPPCRAELAKATESIENHPFIKKALNQ